MGCGFAYRSVAEMRKHVWRDLADDEVVHPVGGSCEMSADGVLRHIVITQHVPPKAIPYGDLSNDNPSAGTPAVTEVDNEQPDHDNSSPASALVSGPLVFILGEDDGNDDVAGGHPDGAGDEDGLAADFVDVGDGWHGCEPHDDADDATC
jgi:hypothetical protein